MMTTLHALQRVRISADAHAYVAGREGVLIRRLRWSGHWYVEFAETVCGRAAFGIVEDAEIVEVLSGNTGEEEHA